MRAFELFLNSINSSAWLSLIGLAYVFFVLAASIHALLTKEQPGSAIAWLGVILLSPLFGVIVYWMFGVNRIRRRMQATFARNPSDREPLDHPEFEVADPLWRQLMQVGVKLHSEAYLRGNQVEPLINGNQAYVAMLNAIRNARQSVILSSYIFDHDRIGEQFVDALDQAYQRGVIVRVLIDGVGIRYGLGALRTDKVLRQRGIKTARFLPTWSRRGTRFINLRNHRKILSVDGEIAFAGGMNIRGANWFTGDPETDRHAIRDVHFCISGPVINQLSRLFCDDWHFATGEHLNLPDATTSVTSTAEQAICRVLPDGPDDNFQKLRMTLLHAIQAARYSIRIVTPYFIPDENLASALSVAALRGITVEIVVPEKSNVFLVNWAFQANLNTYLRQGLDVYLSNEPFDHSKLCVIDECYCLIGSANWDQRSLELNFEVSVECFSTSLGAELTALIREKQSGSTHYCKSSIRKVPLPIKLRNRIARLASPYL